MQSKGIPVASISLASHKRMAPERPLRLNCENNQRAFLAGLSRPSYAVSITVRSGSRFGLKIDYVCDCVILLRSGWPSQIPDGKGVNANKSGSGDQMYLRTECERGTAGDETNMLPRRLVLVPRRAS